MNAWGRSHRSHLSAVSAVSYLRPCGGAWASTNWRMPILSPDESFPLTVSLDQIETYAARSTKLSTSIKRSFSRVYRDRAKGRRPAVNRQTFVSVHFFFTCWWMARVAVTALRRSANRLGFAAVKQATRARRIRDIPVGIRPVRSGAGTRASTAHPGSAPPSVRDATA